MQNDELINDIASYLEANSVNYDIISQVKAMLQYPTPNIIQEIYNFLIKQHVNKIIVLVVEDMLVSQVERENQYV